MVGAGFSQNAELVALNSKRPPLWPDFSSEMAQRLYPTGGEPHDPLRLAEEYRAALGQQALEGLIRDLVRDAEWKPGPLHGMLLDLPWADVLTTNWDTLLERAAEVNLKQSYEVVRAVQDIPRTRAPRIVKLHGSMPSNRPFIFAEEDYRTYPIQFAPYVNLAQQVLLENELCLLGFSGDDPNFLHWSGWVRDHLGASARRMHLVGVLNITSARRKFFEARNVSPIDLAPLVADVEPSAKHRIATERLLDYLRAAKPRPLHEWPEERKTRSSSPPSIQRADAAAYAQHIHDLLAVWQRDRATYPGWLACPFERRQTIRSDTDLSSSFQIGLKQMEIGDKHKLLNELAWRCDVSFLPLPTWLRDNLADAVRTSGIPRDDSQQTLYLASLLLRESRVNREESDFNDWCGFIESIDRAGIETTAQVAYEKCLWARDHLDYAALQKHLGTLHGGDPAWRMRRAALHCELGEFEAARAVLEEAMRDLRERYARDRRSVWVLSRLAWAAFLARAVDFFPRGGPRSGNGDVFVGRDEWPEMFREIKSDPWDELQSLHAEVERWLREQAKEAVTKEPLFEPGSYVSRSSETRFVSPAVVSPASELLRLADTVGLPVGTDHIDVMGSHLRRAFELGSGDDERRLQHCCRILRSHTDDLVEMQFGRICVARMKAEVVAALTERLWRAIDYGIQRFRGEGEFYWINRVLVHTELLSRLAVRLSSQKAIEGFRKACAYAKDTRWAHWWLYEPLEHLLERCLGAVHPTDKKLLVLDVLEIPLPDERDIKGMEDHWPELIESLDSKAIVLPTDLPAFKHRVATLIDKVKSSSRSRARAALRLTMLAEAGILDSSEQTEFGVALWSRRASNEEFPIDTNLYSHVFLRFPGPSSKEAERIFRSKISTEVTAKGLSEEFLISLHGSRRTIALSTGEALTVLDAILAWKPKEVQLDLGHIERRNRGIARWVGPALVDAILPVLDLQAIGTQRLDSLYQFIESGCASSAVMALPEMLRIDTERTAEAIKLIHRAILSSEPDVTYAGFAAIARWKERLRSLPGELTQAVVVVATTRREPGLVHALDALAKYVSERSLSDYDKWRLADALDLLHAETAYENLTESNEKAITLTLVRAASVRLAHELKKSGTGHKSVDAWLDRAKSDPMPEVRYAVIGG
jgi:hypothetical protein